MNRLVQFRSGVKFVIVVSLLLWGWAFAGCRGTETVLMPGDSPATAEPVSAPAMTAVPISSPSPTTTLPTATASPQPTVADVKSAPWWNDVVFYELFVRSYQDSDGDGVGDLQGVIDRLDYLNDGDSGTDSDLGVTGIWLMPITESPTYHGYSVVDYYQVDREYGDNDTFRLLLDEAHARGIRVIVDLVLNHTGRDHPWFQEALDPGSDRREWYVWADESPGYRGPAGEVVWHNASSGYYYGVFDAGLPDLNYSNSQVTAAMQDVARFWLEDMGVDGFRLDAIKHLVENGPIQENTRETHQWLQGFHQYYKELNPQAVAVGEAWTSTGQVVEYTGDEVDIAFAFDLALDILNSSDVGLGSVVAKAQAEMVESFPPGQYATFLTNHDQNRVMSRLDNDEGAARVAAAILLTSPGVPFIYYGEEIGMKGSKPDEDIRLPMQWDSRAPGAGFTDSIPWRMPADDFSRRNVANQDEDPDSLLNYYRTLIRLRSDHPALRTGSWSLVEAAPARLYAYLREDETETLLVLLNLSRRPVNDYQLSLEQTSLRSQPIPVLLFGGSDQEMLVAPDLNARGGFTSYRPLDSLPPQSGFVIHLSTE